MYWWTTVWWTDCVSVLVSMYWLVLVDCVSVCVLVCEYQCTGTDCVSV